MGCAYRAVRAWWRLRKLPKLHWEQANDRVTVHGQRVLLINTTIDMEDPVGLRHRHYRVKAQRGWEEVIVTHFTHFYMDPHIELHCQDLDSYVRMHTIDPEEALGARVQD